MELLFITIILIIVFLIVGAVIFFSLLKIVKKSITDTATTIIDRAVDAGVRGIKTTVTDKVLDRALDVGERELMKGAKEVGKVISHEMLKSDPKKMATEVTKVAQRNKGELTVSNVMTELNVPDDLATKTLEDMVCRKLCFVECRGEQMQDKVYIFPAFKKKRQIKKCEYCGSKFGLTEAKADCSSCGAKLTIATIWE